MRAHVLISISPVSAYLLMLMFIFSIFATDGSLNYDFFVFHISPCAGNVRITGSISLHLVIIRPHAFDLGSGLVLLSCEDINDIFELSIRDLPTLITPPCYFRVNCG